MNLHAKFQHCSSQGSYGQTDKRLDRTRLRLTVIYYTTITKRAILKKKYKNREILLWLVDILHTLGIKNIFGEYMC